ncbi:MAG: serine hydrolase domain-containing protein [Pyrinomonadaceae bacterium]
MLVRKLALVGLLSLLTALPVMAQSADAPKLPETQAGQRVAAYIQAFNSGDEQLMRAFIAANVAPSALQQRPVDARIEVYREMRAEIGTLTLRRVSEARADAITIAAQSKQGELLTLGFVFEPAPPHKLLGLRIEQGEAPTANAPESSVPAVMSEQEVLQSIEKYLNERVAADEFSGTVLVAKQGQPIWQRAYGLASKEYNVPNRLDTKFNLGSINKLFTQIAIGQLVEQGKLAYDDKLGKYLPDYPNRDAAEKVTIKHLLAMTSGIGDFFGPKYQATPKNNLRTIKDYLPLFAAEPLAFAPGTQNQYSNGGYIVLGAIIEQVTGQDYYEYVRAHIFQPAGMTDTDWYEADQPTPNLASGYTREGAGGPSGSPRRNNIYTRPAKGSPAGGGYSTAEDMLKLARALASGKLHVPNFRQASAAGSPNTTGQPAQTFSGIGIAGGSLGINAIFEVDPDSGYTVIVMSNYDPPSAEQVGRQLRGWLKQIKR